MKKKSMPKISFRCTFGIKEKGGGSVLGRESNKTRQDSLETFIRGGTGCKYNQKVQTCTHPVW